VPGFAHPGISQHLQHSLRCGHRPSRHPHLVMLGMPGGDEPQPLPRVAGDAWPALWTHPVAGPLCLLTMCPRCLAPPSPPLPVGCGCSVGGTALSRCASTF
jgi:hypothetical protein